MTEESNRCPQCGNVMKVRDSKRRKVKDENGTEYIFSLRRFQCGNCQKLHLEMPDCIVPYKQYSKKVIDDVLNGRCNYYIVDTSTVWHWKNNIAHPVYNDIIDLK